MKVYELLQAVEDVCKHLNENGVKATDERYLQLYADWVRMRNEGQKYQYIVYYLSTQYNVSESGIARIVKRFEKEAKL